MHERNRRQLCRLLFVALCVAPALVTGTWAGYRSSSVYASRERSAWQQAILQRTGLLATLERVERPAGGSTLLHGIELTDPDGGDRVARVRLAEIAVTDDGTIISLSQPEIGRGQFLRLWEVFHERVLRGAMQTSSCQLVAGELTLEIGEFAQTFTRVHCTIDATEAGVQSTVDFQLAGLQMPSPARLHLHRNRQTIPPSTHWSFESETPIPCALFADYLRWTGRLGPSSTFQGRASAILANHEWQAEASGRFAGIDLDRATELLPYKITGSTDVMVDRALFQDGILREIRGKVACQGGMVSPSLLVALAEQMQASVPPELVRWPDPYLTFSELAFAFDVSSAGIKVEGQCASTDRRVVMNSAGGRLLLINPDDSHSVAAIVRALSPGNESLVPATEESKWLIDILALPTNRPVRTDNIASPPRARVRLR